MTRFQHFLAASLMALASLAAGNASAQQNPLPCVAGSPTQIMDEAVWKRVQALDHAVAYARYVRMFTACHGETAIRRIRELQDEAIRQQLDGFLRGFAAYIAG